MADQPAGMVQHVPDGNHIQAQEHACNGGAPCGATVKENTCCGLKLLAPDIVGPFIRYSSMVETQGNPPVWTGSCLMLMRNINVDEARMKLVCGTVKQEISPQQLTEYEGWVVLKYGLQLPLGTDQQEVAYSITGRSETYKFFLPGLGKAVRWGFYSCSGFTSDVPAQAREFNWKGLSPLWKDVLARHAASPLHLMVGGGDQLYNDDVWTAPALQPWLKTPKDQKENADFTKDMSDEVNSYYFHHYAVHFSIPAVAQAYATIPQVMTWDDHDIFDGWGSYPKYLQTSIVFQEVFAISHFWYCIFQQHCLPADKKDVQVVQLGRRLAIVMPDQRTKRWMDQIMPLDNYMEISLLGKELPRSVKHVVLVSTVPVVYPHMVGAQGVVSCMGGTSRLLEFMGSSPLNQFGEPELMDDLMDHWTSKGHRDERRFFIEQLQMLAKFRGLRITLISGDVHLCATGRLLSHPMPVRESEKDKLAPHDFRYMQQVVSSAIANPPPPQGLLTAMEHLATGGLTNMHTSHEMIRLFKTRHGKPATCMLNRRNWCEVTEYPDPEADSRESRLPVSAFNLAVLGQQAAVKTGSARNLKDMFSGRGNSQTGALRPKSIVRAGETWNEAELAGYMVFALRVENAPPADAETLPQVDEYRINVPRLTVDPSTGDFYDPRIMSTKKKVARKFYNKLNCFSAS